MSTQSITIYHLYSTGALENMLRYVWVFQGHCRQKFAIAFFRFFFKHFRIFFIEKLNDRNVNDSWNFPLLSFHGRHEVCCMDRGGLTDECEIYLLFNIF